MLAALSAIFSYVEVLIPIPLGVPGIKLGLANIVIVFALYKIDFGSAILISIVRIIIVSALFANPMMAMYSLAGTMLSLIVMYLLKKVEIFSITGVSMAGGVFHNVGQVSVAALVVETVGLFSYLTILIPVGMITGAVIGVVSDKAIRNINKLPI